MTAPSLPTWLIGRRRQTPLARWAIILLTASVALLTSVGVTVVNGVEETSDREGFGRWWQPGEGRQFPKYGDYANANGILRVLLDNGPLDTSGHAFFESLGTNGRACVTCHQPADAMSLSAQSVRDRWRKTNGADPLFAAYDGSNCPSLPQGKRSSHSLILDHGLIRIERPWPPVSRTGETARPDFKLEVVRDPYGCNGGKSYGPEAGRISVYRRPRPSANLKYLLAIGFGTDPKKGLPLDIDEKTGKPLTGNLLADARFGTLAAQIRDAAASHLERKKPLTTEQVDEIETFLLHVYTAQLQGPAGGRLDADGALGGPGALADSEPGRLGSVGKAVWSEFASWETLSDAAKTKLTPDQIAFRESVARGARIFREKTFLITDSAGINSPIGFGNPVRNSCVFCHNMSQMGNDVAPGQVDLGTTTLPFADPAPHLPLFKITCTGDPHPHYGRVMYTSDPGYALTTGRCADVGKITLQSMRGLSGRAPFFSNGSAAGLRAVIDYYERRYSIGYTEQEKQDLVNLMKAL